MQRQTYRNKIHKRKYRHAPVLLLWCMLLLGAGCGNLYTGEEPLYDPNNPGGQGDQTQLPVMVAFSDPIYNVLTRGRECWILKMKKVSTSIYTTEHSLCTHSGATTPTA